MGVLCAPNSLRIHFANTSSAATYAEAWANGTVVFLRYEWGCGDQVRMFVSTPYTEAHVLVVRTINVTLAHAFRSASVRFHTNHSHDGEAMALQAASLKPRAAHSSGAQHARRRSLWSSLEDIASAALDAVETGVQYILTGVVNVDSPFTSSYTLPTVTLPVTSEGDNTNSIGSLTYGGSLTFTSGFGLHIDNYVFQDFDASVAASALVTLTPSIEASASYSTSDQQQLSQTTTNLGSVNVFGIPIPINLIVTTYGGYSLNMAASASIAGTITASGSASFTLSCTSDGPCPQMSSDATFNVDSTLDTAQYSGSAQFLPYLSVSAYLQAAYVGGPVGVATVYGDINGEISSTDNSCLNITEDTGVEVDVAAKYSLQFNDHNFGSGSTPWATLYGLTPFWSSSQQCCP